MYDTRTMPIEAQMPAVMSHLSTCSQQRVILKYLPGLAVSQKAAVYDLEGCMIGSDNLTSTLLS